MSNENYSPRGENQQRRRSNHNPRGGRNRNQQNRGPRSGSMQQGDRRERGPRPDAVPVKVSLFQRVLRFFGLAKKAPAPIERRPERAKLRIEGEDRSPRSNTRVVQGGERGGRGERNDRDERGGRGGRGERNDRDERGGRGERGERNERGGRGERGERNERGDASRERRSNDAVQDVDSSRLYVGNLSYEVSEGDLVDLFKGVGAVRSAEIVYNRHTHRSKGYAFVEMEHVDDAKRAMEVLHDQHFMGRKLNISGAQSKPYDKDDDMPEIRLAEIPANREVVEVAKQEADVLKEKPLREEVISLAAAPVEVVKSVEVGGAVAEVAAESDEVKVS